MKQHDVTFKTEVTTTVIQEPSVVVSQYELEQRKVTTPMSFVTEKVGSLSTSTDVTAGKRDVLIQPGCVHVLCRNFSSLPLRRGSSRRSSSVS